MKKELRVLDLYCGIGGASEGYHQAGLEVVGVELNPKCEKYYPYKFLNKDVLELDPAFLSEFDLIHASAPCQAFSLLKHRTGKQYDNLIPATRELILASGVDYIMENVEQAQSEFEDSIILCGTMFDLGANCRDGQYRQLWRHRAFETSFDVQAPSECKHVGNPVGCYGDGGGGQQTRGWKAYADEGIEAMDLPYYAPRKYVNQAIPPAYSKYLAEQWLQSK